MPPIQSELFKLSSFNEEKKMLYIDRGLNFFSSWQSNDIQMKIINHQTLLSVDITRASVEAGNAILGIISFMPFLNESYFQYE